MMHTSEQFEPWLTPVEQRILEKTGFGKKCAKRCIFGEIEPSPFSTLSTIVSVGTPLTWFKLKKRTLDANDAYS